MDRNRAQHSIKTEPAKILINESAFSTHCDRKQKLSNYVIIKKKVRDRIFIAVLSSEFV